jgi:hypothetical protein
MAGPIARAIETVVWERPLVAPSERLFGDEAVINMKIQPITEIVREETTGVIPTYRKPYP